MIQSVVLLLVGAVIGAVFGAWSTVYLRRPKLQIVGYSGASTAEFAATSITIENRPGLLGVSVNRTIIFGKRIHRGYERGLTITREDATECHATLYERRSGDLVGALWWMFRDGTYDTATTLGSGESVDLMIFMKRPGEPTYSPFNADVVKPTPGYPSPVVPKFDGAHDFEVRLSYSRDHRLLKIPLTVRPNYLSGGLRIVVGKGIGEMNLAP